jgi:hypothetical protein
MTSPAIVQALPYVNWIVLVALAVGSFAYAAFARQVSDVTRGYAGFSAFAAVLLAMLALASDFGLPPPDDLAIATASADIELLRRAGLAAFITAALVYIIVLRRGARTLPLAALTMLSGAIVLLAAAVGWAPSLADSVPLLVQLSVLSAAAGGSLACLTLGHWYLVTPRLSERPLVLLTRLLTLTVCLQLALFVIWTTIAGGPGQAAFDAFAGDSVLYVVLRLVVSILFPLVLSYMALRTATTRSMESATGLLYIDLAAILAGTIGAAALYVSAGLLV